MVVAAVDEALTVVLVVEPAGDPRDRGSPELLSKPPRSAILSCWLTALPNGVKL